MKKCTTAAQFCASLTPDQKETIHQLLRLSNEDAGNLEWLVYDLLMSLFPNPRRMVARGWDVRFVGRRNGR